MTEDESDDYVRTNNCFPPGGASSLDTDYETELDDEDDEGESLDRQYLWRCR